MFATNDCGHSGVLTSAPAFGGIPMKVLMLVLPLLFWTGCTRTAPPTPPRLQVSKPDCDFEHRKGRLPVQYEIEFHCKASLTTDDPELKNRAYWVVLTRKRIFDTFPQEQFQDDESLQTKVIMRGGVAKISSNVTYVFYGSYEGAYDPPPPPKLEWEPIGFVPLQNYELAPEQ
jgi:hypothetical protein